MFKIICILGVVVLACQQLEAAPRPHLHKSLQDMSQAELAYKFDEFMHDDKQMAEIKQLYKEEVVGHDVRKRQAEIDAQGDEDTDVVKAEGFIDRAAKFVMEVLQRFLKWINQD